MEWMSCKELAAATGHSYEAVRKALRNAHDAPQPRTVRGHLLEWPAELTPCLGCSLGGACRAVGQLKCPAGLARVLAHGGASRCGQGDATGQGLS